MRTRTILRLLVAALTTAPATALSQEATVPAFRQLDSIEARVQGCVTCHGHNGQGAGNGIFPRIAAKPAGYLYNQLIAFRDGSRQYAPMNYLVAYLPDRYLHEMADYFASQRPPFPPREAVNVEAAILARGQALVTNGDASKAIPACVACHGSGLTGMNPGIPGLVGLRASYITAQLTRWRVNERHATEPDCMRRIASRLSDADVTAAAAWLAAQDPPRDPSPESSNLVRMPFACGSQR